MINKISTYNSKKCGQAVDTPVEKCVLTSLTKTSKENVYEKA